MTSRNRHLLTVAIGTLLLLVGATTFIRVRFELETARESARLQKLLQTTAGALQAELERGERSLAAPTPGRAERRWKRWRLDSAGYRDERGDGLLLSESALRRALSGRSVPRGATVLLGLMATDQGGAALVLARAESADGGESEWRGVWQLVDDVVQQAAFSEVSRQGYRLQVYSVADAVPIYQSEAGTWPTAVAVPVRFGGAQLELRAARQSDLVVLKRLLPAALLLALAVLIWPLLEVGRVRTSKQAADDLAEAEGRRVALNAKYGAALEQLEALERNLQIASTYDSFTGLGNRTALLRRVETALDALRQSRQGSLAVLAIGFDQIQQIRNSFGAGYASRILGVVAERVQCVVPSKDLLFSTGDFHLAAALPDTDATRSAEVARRIIGEIESPITLDGHGFLLRPGVGIAVTGSGYERGEALLDQASSALSALPRDAPSRFCLFDSETTRESVSRLQLEVDLERAFEERQFVLEYEPLVVPVSGTVAGFEALIRWNHPTEGRLTAGRFVPIAMEAGLAHRLNSWVLREAARQAAIWHRAGHEDLFVNVNLSAEAFLRPHLAQEIGALLAEFALPGHRLMIELTESTLVQDLRGAARTLGSLGEIGVGAWLDDFGTGYSSLGHLRSLPLRGVKVDRSFIEHIDTESRDFGLVKAMIDLISYLGMQSVVEGVETGSQYDLLGLTACDLYQGHFFTRSLPALEAERWMSARAAGSHEPLRGDAELLPQRRQGSG